MEKILVSACLLGLPVRYNGRSEACAHRRLLAWGAEGRIVPFCPEVAAGLATPRPAAEIQGPGGGQAVLSGVALVRTGDGTDLTATFQRAAELALAVARSAAIRIAILKDGSPSCGSRRIHDGNFIGGERQGQGVTAALLTAHGIQVFSETDIDAAAAWLQELERVDQGHSFVGLNSGVEKGELR